MSKKILIIGNGKWSKTLQRVLQELKQEVIVATHDWQQHINNVSKAIVATPAETHFYIANELLRLKIPTLIEKPAVLSLEHAEILEYHSRIMATPIFCHTPYLYHSLIQQLKEDFKGASFINYASYRANIEGNHRDGNSFINHGAHDLANLWNLGIRQDLKIDQINFADNLINVQMFNSQAFANITTGELQKSKTRYIIVDDGTYNQRVQIVNDNTYIQNDYICPKYRVLDEPLRLSLSDFVFSTSAKCGIDFIKWASKVLEQVTKI